MADDDAPGAATLKRLERSTKVKKAPPSMRQPPATMEDGQLKFSRSVPSQKLNQANIQARYVPSEKRAAERQRAKDKPGRTDAGQRPFPGAIRKTRLRQAQEADEAAARELAAAAALGAAAAQGGGCAAAAVQPKKDDDSFLHIDQSKMPLHIYDDDDLELRTPQEWVESGSAASTPYYLGAEKGWQWVKCEVLGYDESTMKFEVRMDGAKEGQRKHVRRLNLLFAMESKEVFERRVAHAEGCREDAKALMRLDHYISGKDTKDIAGMSGVTLSSIHGKMTDALTADAREKLEAQLEQQEDQGPTKQALLVRGLAGEVVTGYTRSMKVAAMDQILAGSVVEQQRYAALKLPPRPPPAAPPRYGKCQLPAVDALFEDIQAAIRATHYAASPEVLGVISWMSDLWGSKFEQQTFMDTQLATLELPCDLTAFKDAQSKHCTKLTEMLEVEWHKSTTEHFTDAVQDIHDFYQSDRQAFDTGALWNLLKSMELRMTDQLRHVLEHSLSEWLSLLVGYVPLDDGISTTANAASKLTAAETTEGKPRAGRITMMVKAAPHKPKAKVARRKRKKLTARSTQEERDAEDLALAEDARGAG